MTISRISSWKAQSYWTLVIGLIGFFTIFHSWQIAEIPRGLYVDETSVGHNASLIARLGVDEYGVPFPIFFKAFGEYKNPLYIYTTAALFYVFGPSVWLLRFTSVLYFTLFLIAFTILVERMFKERIITLFLVVSAGTLPWFFTVSRISFEGMIAQLTFSTYGLLCTHYAFHHAGHAEKRPFLFSLLGGVSWGLSAYTYSTARLLAFACAGITILVYLQYKTLRRVLGFGISFAITLLPFAWFAYHNPGAMTLRFRTISYLYDSSLSVWDKLQAFIATYSWHFGPSFLLHDGDANLRHSTGYGGVIFSVLFVLASIGCIYLFTQYRHNRFHILLIALLFISPSAAALTTGDSGQALRALLMGLMILLMAGYGLHWLYQSPHRMTIITGLFLALTIEASGYLYHYFTDYPKTTISWFETYGLPEALTIALQHHPKKITVEPNVHQIITNVSFYRDIIPGLRNTLIAFEWPHQEKGTCSLSFYADPGGSSSVEIAIPQSPVKVRCY